MSQPSKPDFKQINHTMSCPSANPVPVCRERSRGVSFARREFRCGIYSGEMRPARVDLKQSNTHSQFVRKFVIGLLIAVFCAGLFSNVFIHLSYWSNMPRTPDPARGRVLLIKVNHGTMVYVSRQELDRARFVFGFGSYVTIGAGILLAFVRIYWDDPSKIGANDSDKLRDSASGS